MQRLVVVILRLYVATFLATVFAAVPAYAHWCNDNWGSSYNITVKPETDTLSVPASGSAQLVIWVQNNMGYALENFSLSATASGYTVNVAPDALTVANHLMPSEKVRYVLTVSKAGGDTLSVESLDFGVRFGGTGQSGSYGQNGSAVMIKKSDGSLYPGLTSPIGGNDQALHHRYAAFADFGDTSAGVDELLQEYCAGRRSWDHTSKAVITQYCSDTSSTTCSDRAISGPPSKYDLQKLWTTYELAIRKIALGDRVEVLRERLQCGWDDPDLTFQALSAFTLGYLGEDAAARTFLNNIISTGTPEEADIAKASLLLMGNSDDLATYGSEVSANVNSGSVYVANVSAAVLAIVEGNDSAVQNVLLQNARWFYPEDDSTPFLASHLLGIVAWDRRGWNEGAGDLGGVTFYDEDAPDCSAASVSPLSGDVSLTATLDASSCTAAEGNDVSYRWTIEETSYTEATTEHTFTEPGNYVVRLIVTEDAATPSVTTRTFNVSVLGTGSGEAGTGGSSGTGGTESSGGAGESAGGTTDSSSSGGTDTIADGGENGTTSGAGGGTDNTGGGGSGTDSSSTPSGSSGTDRTVTGAGNDGGLSPDGGDAQDDNGGCSCSMIGNTTRDLRGVSFVCLLSVLLFIRRRLRRVSA